MAPLPSDFTSCERETLHTEAEDGSSTEPPPLKARGTLAIGKSLLWSAWPIDSAASTDALFNDLWNWLGKDGKRYLSVRRGTDGSLWVLLFKGDQAELNLGGAPEEMRPTALYKITKPGNGQAATRAIAQFAREGLVRRLRRGHIELSTRERQRRTWC